MQHSPRHSPKQESTSCNNKDVVNNSGGVADAPGCELCAAAAWDWNVWAACRKNIFKKY
jgi:hypothetical protein